MNRCILLTVILLALAVLMSCEKEEAQSKEPSDKLEEKGILGSWKLESRTRNGITNMAVPCCDTLMYSASGTRDDLNGTFKVVGAGYETSGEFELIPTTNNIRFTYDDTQKIYQYKLSSESINFSYQEEQDDIQESWRKVE